MKKIKKISIKLIFTRSYIKEKRNSIKFNFLRNLNEQPQKLKELENKIGTFFELPHFGSSMSDYVPKDYVSNEPYFFTKQRFLIFKEAIENKKGGLLLSGPHGVGKSYISYLIATYAYVNSYPLLYIPKCSSWVRKISKEDFDCNGPALYWLNRFYELNYDIINKYENLKSYKKDFHSLEEKEWKNKTNCSELQSYIMKSLSKHIETPVVSLYLNQFYIFDEHNELFNKDNATNLMPIDFGYFKTYKQWAGPTGGVNIK